MRFTDWRSPANPIAFGRDGGEEHLLLDWHNYGKVPGLIVPDYSGWGHHADLGTKRMYVSSPIGPTLNFGGTQSFQAIDGYIGPQGASPRSIEFVFQTPSEQDRCIWGWGSATTGQKWVIRTDLKTGSDYTLRVEIQDNAVQWNTKINDGLYHHAIISWEAAWGAGVDAIRLYLNGLQDTIYGGSGGTINTTGSSGLYLGADHAGATPFFGHISLARIYGRSMTLGEAQERYARLQDTLFRKPLWVVSLGSPPPEGRPWAQPQRPLRNDRPIRQLLL